MVDIKMGKVSSLKVFSVTLLLIGEILIIISFLYFGRNFDQKPLTLNIIISSIIYFLLFIDLLFPMVDFNDKSNKTVGSLGLRWAITFLYMVCAITAMVMLNITYSISISSQAIIHAVLIFFLSLGLYLAYASSAKVNKVFLEENKNRSGLEEIIKIVREVQLKLDQMNNIPVDITKRFKTLQDNLRFIAPSNNREIIEIENVYLKEVKLLQSCLFDIPMNYNKITESVQRCERIYKEYKQFFSN